LELVIAIAISNIFMQRSVLFGDVSAFTTGRYSNSFYKTTSKFDPIKLTIAFYREHLKRYQHHFVSHHQYYHQNNCVGLLDTQLQNQTLNFLCPHHQWFSATCNILQLRLFCVSFRAMKRPRLEPKHVRNFFYEHALSVRIITLIFDLIWQIITGGLLYLTRGLWRKIQNFLPVRLSIDEHIRKLHTFIVGKTGVGKSVLLHHLIRHYQIKNVKPAVVVIDPHGDLAEFVARDKSEIETDRLVFIQFNSAKHIHFNPFDLKDPTEDQLNRAQIQFAGAVEQIIGEDFTPRQRTLIRACLGIMLHKPNTTLLDLVRVLQDGQNADLIRYGQQSLSNEVDRQFFAHSFRENGYRTTKQALVARLIDIVRDPVVRRFTCHPSTINLGQLLDAGKLIVIRFDSSQQSPDTIRTIGQLINAAIFSHVLGRKTNRRKPIHVFIDECQYFISPTISDILGEARKFGLYLTLATQRIERLSSPLQDAILGNVGTLWVGGSRHITAEKMAKEANIPADQIRFLRNLEFFHVTPNRPTKRQRVRFIGGKYTMSKHQWRQKYKEQIRKYYRAFTGRKSLSKPSETTNWEPPNL